MIDNLINERNKNQNLHGSYDHLLYMVNELYSHVNRSYEPVKLNKVLYVGIGHGLDAIIALMSGKVQSVVGIDTYLHNNHEFVRLKELINYYQLNMEVHKVSLDQFIQSYTLDQQTYTLDQTSTNDWKYDAIICCDVLHHIFATGTMRLRDSTFKFIHALSAFRSLKKISDQLIISDVQRHGLRPLLTKYNILHGNVNYQKKQDWKEWNHCITSVGWALDHKQTYTPFKLKSFKNILNNELAQHTICDRYFLYYSHTNN